MSEFEQMRRGQQLLSDGRSDEDVEDLTGISLLKIVELRGEAAAAPGIVTEINFAPAPFSQVILEYEPSFRAIKLYTRSIGSHDQGAAG